MTAPTGCRDDPYIECDRCPYCTPYYQLCFFYIPLWVAMVGIMIATGILVNSVRKTEKNAAKWRPSSVIDQVEREGRTPRANAAIIEERRKKRKARRMTRAVTAKAIKYNSVLWLTYGPLSLNRTLQMLGDSYFWVMLLHVTFTPMQGFFNCIVYAEPRLQQWRKDRKDARSRSRRVAERSERQHRVHSDDSIVVERASGDDDSDDDDDFDVDDVRISLN